MAQAGSTPRAVHTDLLQFLSIIRVQPRALAMGLKSGVQLPPGLVKVAHFEPSGPTTFVDVALCRTGQLGSRPIPALLPPLAALDGLGEVGGDVYRGLSGSIATGTRHQTFRLPLRNREGAITFSSGSGNLEYDDECDLILLAPLTLEYSAMSLHPRKDTPGLRFSRSLQFYWGHPYYDVALARPWVGSTSECLRTPRGAYAVRPKPEPTKHDCPACGARYTATRLICRDYVHNSGCGYMWPGGLGPTAPLDGPRFPNPWPLTKWCLCTDRMLQDNLLKWERLATCSSTDLVDTSDESKRIVERARALWEMAPPAEAALRRARKNQTTVQLESADQPTAPKPLAAEQPAAVTVQAPGPADDGSEQAIAPSPTFPSAFLLPNTAGGDGEPEGSDLASSVSSEDGSDDDCAYHGDDDDDHHDDDATGAASSQMPPPLKGTVAPTLEQIMIASQQALLACGDANLVVRGMEAIGQYQRPR